MPTALAAAAVTGEDAAMSDVPPDLIDRMRAELRQRLDELADVVSEEVRLRAALHALDSTAPAAGPQRSRPGGRRAQVRAAVQAEPGGRTSDVAAVADVSAAYASRLLAELAERGDVEKRGGGWYPAADDAPEAAAAHASAGA